MPETSLTVGSPVVGGVAKSDGLSSPSLAGVILIGWPNERFAPKTSVDVMVPVTATVPLATVRPTATDPSWQLRQSLEDPAPGVWVPDLYVVLV